MNTTPSPPIPAPAEAGRWSSMSVPELLAERDQIVAGIRQVTDARSCRLLGAGLRALDATIYHRSKAA